MKTRWRTIKVLDGKETRRWGGGGGGGGTHE